MKTVTFKYLFIFFLAILSIATECGKDEPDETIFLFPLFTITPETGPISTTFTFDARESYVAVSGNKYGVVNRWAFDYIVGAGESNWDTEYIVDYVVTHQYTEAKTYQVVLEVKYNNLVDVRTKPLTVTGPEAYPPVAVFSINPATGNTLTEFTFDASGCIDESTPTEDLEVVWDFDNNGGWDTFYSKDKVVTHQYDQEGTHEVRMNVKDADGNTTELIKSLTVENCNQGGEPCEDIAFVNHQGEQYNTVQIGSQCWLDRNLNSGEMIESVNNQSNQTDNGVVEKFCYDNDSVNCQIYGGLYQWNEMMNYSTTSNQGICPDGWHVPSTTDWHTLVNYLGGEDEASGKLRSCTDDWKYAFGVNSNESGFTALPTGIRFSNSPFDKISEVTIFWTSTTDVMGADVVSLHYVFEVGFGLLANFKSGYSVRCIKD